MKVAILLIPDEDEASSSERLEALARSTGLDVQLASGPEEAARRLRAIGSGQQDTLFTIAESSAGLDGGTATEATATADVILRRILEQADEAVFTTNNDGMIGSWNPMAEKVFGVAAAEALDRGFRQALRGVGFDSLADALERFSASPVGKPQRREIRCKRGLGVIDLDVSFASLIDDAGASIGVAVLARDVTERRRADDERDLLLERERRSRIEAEDARRRAIFLSESGSTLSSSLNYQQTLAAVAQQAVPHLADWCAVDMLAPDGAIQRLAVAHVDPAKIEWAIELQKKFPPDPNGTTGVPEVIRSGRSEFFPEITDEMLASAARTPEELEIGRRVGFTSVMIVPVSDGVRTVGAITFVTAESGRRYSSDDLTMAEDLARLAGIAIEHARLYDEVSRHRELLQVTLGSIGDAVIATDVDGRVTFLNQVAEAVTGWRREEAEGLPIEEVFRIRSEETGEPVGSPVERVLEHGAIVGLANHTVLVTREGSEIPIDDSAAPIRGEDGTVRGVVMVFRDVTERRSAEQERRLHEREMGEQRARLSSIVRSVPGIVWEMWGSMNSAGHRIDFVSEYVQEMLGYSPTEWLRSPNFWNTVVHPDDRERFQNAMAEILAGGTGGVVQFRCIARSGTVIWVEARSTVILDPDGKPAGMRGVTMEITNRKLAEEEMIRAREEAEAANRSKDQFLAVLSHELRTPLTPVLAVTHVLENDERITSDQRPLVEMIRRNIELEARLIDDLLDLTRISKGKLTLSFETADVHRLINSVLSICRADINGKRLNLLLDLQARDHFIRADSARMQQVFWNLIKNAVKFTPEGGRITVKTFNDKPGRLSVEVNDSGIGIDPQILPRVFGAFEQGDLEITRQFGGLGLGLAISRSLVQMHGGLLTARSEGRDKGSTFTVSLETVVRLRESAPRDGHGAVRVLIVDDHIETSKVMKLLLERRGYVVMAAHSLSEAVAATEQQEFDLLISDIGLPDGSGLDLMRKLAHRDIRGIALSGFGMEEDIARSKEAGFSEHLIKPVSFQSLQETIGRVLA